LIKLKQSILLKQKEKERLWIQQKLLLKIPRL
jgi:hypothetical protein